MIFGCYTLDLYCDNDFEHPYINYEKGNFGQFVGKNLTECKRMARKVGWGFYSNKCYCPYCKGKKNGSR